MYREFYGLDREPFRVTPDPDFLFLTHQYREALAAIVYGIANRKGFICLTGEVGTGKTTILRSYLRTVDDKTLKFVYVFNPAVSFGTLVRDILRDLGAAGPDEADVPDMVRRLHEYLVASWRAGVTVVLLVDEAQNMPMATIEALRMLSNLETATDKLIQIVLIGQPELEVLLARPQLRQLRSRIVVRARLGPISRAESIAYIRHRLGRSAAGDRPVFTRPAMAMVADCARGIPRIINILADNALVTGFGYRRRPIDLRVVREVADDVGVRLPWRWRLMRPAVGAAAALATGLALAAWAGADGGPAKVPAIATALPPAAPALAFAPPPAPVPPAPVPPAPDPPAPAAIVPAPEVPPPAVESTPPEVPPLPEPDEPPPPVVSVVAEPPQELPPPAEPAQVAAVPVVRVDPAVGAAVAARLAAVPVPPLAVRVVRRGDTLAAMARQVYGFADRTTLELLRDHNASIEHVDRLRVGQTIRFPPLSQRARR